MSKHQKKKITQNHPLPRPGVQPLPQASSSAQPDHQLLVDISQLVIKDYKTGIQRVVRSLINEWLSHPPVGYRVELVYATKDQPGYRYARAYGRTLNQGGLFAGPDVPIQARTGDVFLGLDFQQSVMLSQESYYQQLRKLGVKVYFVIYDLLPIQFPQAFPEHSPAVHAQWLDAVAQCDGALCISRSVADEFVAWMDRIKPERRGLFQTGWFHLGADLQSSVPSFGLPPDAQDLLSTLSARPTFLMVGTIEPRKGLAQVLKAFSQLWDQGVDINLVIVGRPGWKTEKLIHQLGRMHVERGRRLFWLRDISDEFLDKLYEASDCLIAASLGEGFGLPLIEAAQHGIPIIARDIPVFREVARDCAHYFGGQEPEALAEAIQEWLTLLKSGQAPASTTMPWLTWKQSAQMATNVILGGHWYRAWMPDDHPHPPQPSPSIEDAVFNPKDREESRPWTRTIGVDAQTVVDAWFYNRPQAESLIHHLEAIAMAAPDWRFFLFSWGLQEAVLPLGRLLALPNIGWRSFPEAGRLPLDLVYDPNFSQVSQDRGLSLWQSLTPGTPLVVAIQELVPFALTEDFCKLFGKERWNSYLRTFDPLRNSPAQILVASNRLKQDLIQFLSIEPARIKIIQAGPHHPPQGQKPEAVRSELEDWGIEPPFFVHIDSPQGPTNRLDTVIEALTHLGNPAVSLVVVGSLDNPALQVYQKTFDEKGMDHILIAGMLPESALACFLQTAVALVHTATHEGFPYPVLEAMGSGCPVIATRAGAIPELTGASALLVPPGDSRALAEAMHRLLNDEDLRTYLRERGLREAKSFSWEDTARRTLEAWAGPLEESRSMKSQGAKSRKKGNPRVRWQGSQFVFHSLAHVNRQLGLGLLRSGAVELSLLPYEPDQFDGSRDPVFRPLADCTKRELSAPADVHIRHHWPPNFNPPAQGAWVIMQPWEYGGIPREWIRPMREQIDEIWVYSTWVRDCYLASGIPGDKVKVIPLGVDTQLFHPEGARYPLKTKRRFRFLYLGGTIHRKGIDILLRAYLKAFRSSDDVCLVIKGQSGYTYLGSELHEVLGSIAQEDPHSPEIEYLTPALDEKDLASLYRACDAFVMPYRGEGFGLPMAEAMASGLPVIATGRGAAMDFLAEDRAYLIPSVRMDIDSVPVGDFRPSAPGFWLEEPEEAAVVDLLRGVYLDPEAAAAKGRQGRDYAEAHFPWDRSTRLVLERIESLTEQTPLRFRENPLRPFREAFLLQPDWNDFAWVEVVITFTKVFQPGEPVALILFIDEAKISSLEVQEAVVSVLSKVGDTEFADIVLLDKPEEILDTLKGYACCYWISDETAGNVAALGPQAQRFFRSYLPGSTTG